MNLVRLLLVVAFSTVPCFGQGGVDVKSCGAKGDGSAVDGAAIRRCLTRHPGGTIVFPAGRYVLDNSGAGDGAGLLIGPEFHGRIELQPGAKLVCNTSTNLAKQCVFFLHASGIEVSGLSIGYLDESRLPLPRNACTTDNAVLIQDSADISLLNTTVDTSPGVGIWVTNSKRIKLKTVKVSNTCADGVHFENSLNSGWDGLWAENTGDDAGAFTNIEKAHPQCGGYGLNSHVKDSHARGLVNVGQCDVLISHFEIDGTALAGVAVNQDLAINGDVPDHTKVEFGTIAGSGRARLATGLSGDFFFCLDIGTATNVEVAGVTCKGPRNDGFFLYGGPSHVSIHDDEVEGSGNVGFQVGGASFVDFTNDRTTGSLSQGFALNECVHCTLTRTVSDRAGSFGFLGTKLNDVTIREMKISNCAGPNGGLAWSLQRTAGPVRADGVQVTDDQPSATCYAMGGYQNGSASIEVTGVTHAIADRTKRFAMHPDGSTERYREK